MIKRASLTLLALLLLPAMAWAQEGTRQTFFVGKIFLDLNPDSVEVTLSCNTGLPLDQSKTIEPLLSAADYVDFVVVDFDSGELDCTATEVVPVGYSPLYIYGWTDGELPLSLEEAESAAGLSPFIDASVEGCFFEDVQDEAESEEGDYFCLVINIPDPVEVEITKDWVIEGDHLNGVDTNYVIELDCGGPIVSATPSGVIDNEDGTLIGSGSVVWWADSEIDTTYTAEVRPDFYQGVQCTVYETVFDSAVEVDNDCGSFVVSVGDGEACTITNTLFFEGIPTLSQYGLALLALLMAGVGFVAFRRVV